MSNLPPGVTKAAATGFDKLLSVQRPVVLAHLRSIRRGHPNATPDQVIRILERRYLAAVTTGGNRCEVAALQDADHLIGRRVRVTATNAAQVRQHHGALHTEQLVETGCGGLGHAGRKIAHGVTP